MTLLLPADDDVDDDDGRQSEMVVTVVGGSIAIAKQPSGVEPRLPFAKPRGNY